MTVESPSAHERIHERPQFASVLLLLLLPLCLNLVHPELFFNNAVAGFDSWYMHGYMHDFAGAYSAGEHQNARVAWTIPGLLVHSLIPAPVATQVLHFAAYSLTLMPFFLILRALSSERQALLISILLGTDGLFVSHIAWDYITAPAFSYQLLILVTLLYSARGTPRRRALGLVLAGIFAGGLISLHFLYLPFLIPLFYVNAFARRAAHGGTLHSDFLRDLGFASLGILASTAALGLCTLALTGEFFFYRTTIAPTAALLKTMDLWRKPFSIWIRSYWLFHLAFASLTSLTYLVIHRREDAKEHRLRRAFVGLITAYMALAIMLQLCGLPFFDVSFRVAFFVPACFLTYGIVFAGSVDKLEERSFWVMAVGLVAITLLPWRAPGASNWAYLGVLGLLLFARHWSWIPLLALTLALSHGSMRSQAKVDAQEGSALYRRIARGLAEIRRFRIQHQQPAPRFWYRKADRHANGFRQLASCYLRYQSDQANFPEIPTSFTSGVLVFCSDSPDSVDEARSVLESHSFEILAQVSNRIEDGEASWHLTLFLTRPQNNETKAR